eukprot:CAMPEP_0178753106 /NCGR_PEP_ID=MMETSP0744-20121128/11431_1 /TAXON_ID=913974 /ORGANISM="Nitzschia punctata, Strain CCMP561" /LENGTH=251 /DNA_ID=CAMNT_0020406893 /DNA_START=29 /DNA_END=784 /DNA_ORIENTATION=-
MTTTSMSIHMNNYAVSELYRGNYKTAYEALSFAVEATHTSEHHSHGPQHCKVPSNAPRKCPYQYSWVDCTPAVQRTMAKDPKLNQGQYAPFLYMKVLVIVPLEQHLNKNDTVSCPCCFAWVLWYNLGVVKALIGRNIDKRGYGLLQESLELFEKVQNRVTIELQQPQYQQVGRYPFTAKHWNTLQLSVWNNQACVLSELAESVMMDHEILHRLVQMGLALTSKRESIDTSDRDKFHWTVQVLMEDKYAAAA